MNRRRFLHLTAAAAVGAGLPGDSPASAVSVSAARLPRWRGFNLLEKFVGERSAPFSQSDFEWIAEWGFDFARLPMSYRCWADAGDWLRLKEPVLKEVDQAVGFGQQCSVHFNLSLHRAPEYCVNPPKPAETPR